jgi:hypothetical protein
LAGGKRYDRQVVKAIEPSISAYPDTTFAIFEQGLDVVAREAVCMSVAIYPFSRYVNDSLPGGSHPDGAILVGK